MMVMFLTIAFYDLFTPVTLIILKYLKILIRGSIQSSACQVFLILRSMPNFIQVIYQNINNIFIFN